MQLTYTDRYMEPSVFTKIIQGEIPSHKVYEDDKTLAFMDIQPVQPGHIVVIPKKQVGIVWDLDDEDYQALMSTVRKVSRRLRQIFPDKKRIGIAIEGLGVKDHAHVNVIPFDTAAEFREIPASSEPDHTALAELADRIRL
jgi:histidine triad (HIT) family protein